MLFGPGEEVTLIDGDILEVFTWHANFSSRKLISGVHSSVPFGEYLTMVKVDKPLKPTPGITLLPAGQGQTAQKIWGVSIQAGAQHPSGGCKIKGKVRIGSGTLKVRLTDLVRGSNDGGPDLISDWTKGHPGNLKLHQQCQCYGNFVGDVVVRTGETFKLSAPGSPNYSQPLGGGPLDDHQKRACYWVPLDLRLTSDGPRPSFVHIRPSDPKEPFLEVFVGASPIAHRIFRSADGQSAEPSEIRLPFEEGMRFSLAFLGGSATNATLSFS